MTILWEVFLAACTTWCPFECVNEHVPNTLHLLYVCVCCFYCVNVLPYLHIHKYTYIISVQYTAHVLACVCVTVRRAYMCICSNEYKLWNVDGMHTHMHALTLPKRSSWSLIFTVRHCICCHTVSQWLSDNLSCSFSDVIPSLVPESSTHLTPILYIYYMLGL